jgi:hypothetical protein
MTGVTTTDRGSFDRFAAVCALASAVGGLTYSVAFLAAVRADSTIGGRVLDYALLLGGLLATAVYTALYLRLRDASPSFALWAYVLGVASAVGTTIHGAFDLANAFNPPQGSSGALPNAVDPRGVLTFFVTAIAVTTFSAILRRDPGFPRWLGILGIVTGVLLVVVYLGRLIALDPNTPWLLGAAGLTGFILVPLLYLGWAAALWRRRAT